MYRVYRDYHGSVWTGHSYPYFLLSLVSQVFSCLFLTQGPCWITVPFDLLNAYDSIERMIGARENRDYLQLHHELSKIQSLTPK